MNTFVGLETTSKFKCLAAKCFAIKHRKLYYRNFVYDFIYSDKVCS